MHSTLRKSFPISLALSLVPALTAQNPGPIPSWLRAPNAQQHFDGNATAWRPTNAFLAMAHATLTGPTDIGFASWSDTATQRAQYEARVRSILLGNGTATYGSGTTARVANGWGYTNVTFFRCALTDTEGYIASNATHTIIAFRGSELSDFASVLQDWVQTDFNVVPVTLIGGNLLPAGFVHAGFLTAVSSVKEQITQQLRDVHGYAPRFGLVNGRLMQIRSNKPIWTTGYSLGGACATLSAFLLSQADNLPVRGTITGGAPTVGNASFANLFLNAGLQIYRHGNNLEVPPLAFAELSRLPGDVTGTVERVGQWVAGNFPDPVRTPMQVLVAAMLAPSNWVAGGVALTGQLAGAANVNYVHFGELRYWDRNAVMALDPSATTRQNDRERTLANGAIAVLTQFLPPAPPSNPYDLVAWANYFSQLSALANRIWNAVSNPRPYVAAMGSTFAQYVTDHSTVEQTRLLFDALPAALRGIESLPKRP